MRNFLFLPFFLIFHFVSHSNILMIDSLRLAQSLNTGNQFQDNFFDGLNKKAIGNYNEAIKAFHSCLELIPENPTVLFLIGDLYLKDKSYELAEKNLNRSISLDPDNFWFKEKLYRMHIEKGDFNQAIKILKSLTYKSIDFKNELVDLYFKNGDFDLALGMIEILDTKYGYSQFRDRIKIDICKNASICKESFEKNGSRETSIKSNEASAEDFLKSGDLEKAIEFYQKAIEDSPISIKSVINLSELYLKTEHYRIAFEFTKLQLDIFPTLIELYFINGTALYKLNKIAKSIEILEDGLDYIFEEDSIAFNYYHLLAKLYKETNNITKANSLIDKVNSLK
tara:strand:- start:515 stop:1531 length:1017 start_codon:yes stop_codon:yes gene_type:complete